MMTRKTSTMTSKMWTTTWKMSTMARKTMTTTRKTWTKAWKTSTTVVHRFEYSDSSLGRHTINCPFPKGVTKKRLNTAKI